MSHFMATSEIFRELSVQQQEQFFGGADFKLGNSNFAEKDQIVIQSNATNGTDNSNFSVNLSRIINTAVLDLLGLNGNIPNNISTLPPPSIF